MWQEPPVQPAGPEALFPFVHDMPGVTRDVVTARGADGAYTMSTRAAGPDRQRPTPARITKASEDQVAFRHRGDHVILFIIDARRA